MFKIKLPSKERLLELVFVLVIVLSMFTAAYFTVDKPKSTVIDLPEELEPYAKDNPKEKIALTGRYRNDTLFIEFN